MRILITGGAGFIGSKLSERLLSLGHSVSVLDNLSAQVHASAKPALPDEVEFVYGDVCDPETVKRAMRGVSVLFHLAAETGVGQSQYEIGRYVSTNTLGTAVVYQAAVELGVERAILTSSRAIYGEGLYSCRACQFRFVPNSRNDGDLANGEWGIRCAQCGTQSEALPMREDHPSSPTSIYGLTKLQQEQIAGQVHSAYGFPTTILRFFNVYGPGQSLTNPYVGVIGTFFRAGVRNSTLNIYEDGKMLRDFVYVDDVVDSLVEVCENTSIGDAVINVGTGLPISLSTVAEEIIHALDSDSGVEISGMYRSGDIRHAVADTCRFTKLLSRVSLTPFSDGIRSYVEWALTQNGVNNSIDAKAELELTEKKILRHSKRLRDVGN